VVARVVLHADMDAFYASIEQRDRPELRGLPVIVGGTGTRGVVSAASYEARAYGVHSAMPSVEARRRCPDGIFLPGRMEHYVAVSRQILRLFEEITPAVEPLSVDEAFLDVTASQLLLGEPLAIAHRLKERVREQTGLTVSIGIAPSKMVAKIASALSKPDGLLAVPPDAVRSFLAPLGIERLWGVGPIGQSRLRALGLHTVGDVARADRAAIERTLGSHGVSLWKLANGDDPRAVEPGRERQSYGEENTFSRDLGDGEEIRSSIIAHAEAVGRRLRRDGRCGGTVTLKVKLAKGLGGGRYPLLTRRTSLPAATDDGHVLAEAALQLWQDWRLGARIRLVGVAVSGICEAPAMQLSLFRDEVVAGAGKRSSLNRAVDEIVDRFGVASISRGLVRAEKAAPTLTLKECRAPGGSGGSDEKPGTGNRK